MIRRTALILAAVATAAHAEEHRYLYVATPGIRDYLEYGGHGLLVFDIDQGHKFVRRIKAAGLDDQGKPRNVKGVCANAATGRIYVSTTHTLTCLNLLDDAILWERSYEGGCDRMSMTPDGRQIYLPSLEKGHWHVVDALTGDVLARIDPDSGAHNTVAGPDGKSAYLAGLRSPLLTVADTSTRAASRTVGPFSSAIRPFTVDRKQARCYVNLNGLLGFEVGDLGSGQKLCRVEVSGFGPGPVKRHGCPSHGIGLTPDERELWVCDSANKRLHVFDATVLPPRQLQSLPVRDEPGWVTFSIDGQYAYPSTGEVFDVSTHKIVTTLSDEHGSPVQSEKMVEVDFADGRPARAGDQFGIGRSMSPFVPQPSGTDARFRSVAAVDDRVAWAGGTKGTVCRTVDGGATWKAIVVPGAEALDFRDIHGVNAGTAYALAAGEGEKSRICKTTDGGATWTTQFQNRDPRVFLDAIAFWDADHGLALGDPVDGRFLLLATADGGVSWRRLPPESSPEALPNEGCFAASGTCLISQGTANAWFSTGGASASRVWRTADRGLSWSVAETPIRAGVAAAGIFSIAFRDAEHGVAVGGDYKDADGPGVKAAVTADGGKTWSSAVGLIAYRSAVAYLPGSSSLLAVGPTGSDLSADGGRTWHPLGAIGYHALSVGPGGMAWAVGDGGRIGGGKAR